MLVHLGYSAGMSLTTNSLDLVAKASSILGFNIFLQHLPSTAEPSAISMRWSLVDKTFPAAQVIEATAHLE